MRAAGYLAAGVLALAAFVGAHWVMADAGFWQFERAAYIAFQGYCKNDPEALCTRRPQE